MKKHTAAPITEIKVIALLPILWIRDIHITQPISWTIPIRTVAEYLLMGAFTHSKIFTAYVCSGCIPLKLLDRKTNDASRYGHMKFFFARSLIVSNLLDLFSSLLVFICLCSSWNSFSMCSILVQPLNQARDRLASSSRLLAINQMGVSGIKNRRMNEITGKAQFTRTVVLQLHNEPMMNSSRIPKLTANVLVAERIPRR